MQSIAKKILNRLRTTIVTCSHCLVRKRQVVMVNNANISETTDKFNTWVKAMDGNALTLWREAMEQIRQLHGDVWNGVRFFLTLNGIIVAGIIAIFRFIPGFQTGLIIAVLTILGLILTIIATSILGKHRDYYLQMLLRKTLLEKELGFYSIHINGVNLSFPWSVEERYVTSEIVTDPVKWRMEQRFRSGTITRLLRLTYWIFIGIYVAIFITVLVEFYQGLFNC